LDIEGDGCKDDVKVPFPTKPPCADAIFEEAYGLVPPDPNAQNELVAKIIAENKEKQATGKAAL